MTDLSDSWAKVVFFFKFRCFGRKMVIGWGGWLLAFGCWWLAVSYWLLAIGLILVKLKFVTMKFWGWALA